eukprot:4214225-Amphidinium_carterae.1
MAGQAWGAGNKMLVGAWLQVAYTVLLSVMVPVWVCWALTQQVPAGASAKRKARSLTVPT